MADKGILIADGFEIQNVTTTGFNAGGTTYTTSTNVTVETSIVKHGAASFHAAPTGAALGRLVTPIPTGNRLLTWSFYVYITSLPASDLIVAQSASVASSPIIVYKQASNKFGMRFGTGASTAFGPTLSNATWYLIDWTTDLSTATFSQTAKVDGGTEVNITLGSATPADMTAASLGTTSTTGPAADMYYDDLVIGTSGYPYGEHEVKLLLPTGDGTHNAGTVIEDAAGTDVTTGVAAFVNEIPAENTDYIQQSASGSGNYAEVTFANPTDATVWGVTAWAAAEAAAVNGSGMIFRIVDSGGTTAVDQGTATGTVSGTTRRWSRAVVPLVGGHTEWSTEPSGDLSGLKGQMGFSTDVVPVPRALLFALQYATPGDGFAAGGDTQYAGFVPI